MTFVAFRLRIELYKGFVLGEPLERWRPICSQVGEFSHDVQATRLPEVGERICGLGPWCDTRADTAIPTAGVEVVSVTHPLLDDEQQESGEDTLPIVTVIAPWNDDDDFAQYVEMCTQKGWHARYADQRVGTKPSDDDKPDSVPANAMRLTHDILFEYTPRSWWNIRGLCHLRIYQDAANASPVVIVGEPSDIWEGLPGLGENAVRVAQAISRAFFDNETQFRLIHYHPNDEPGVGFQEAIFDQTAHPVDPDDLDMKWVPINDIRSVVNGALVEAWRPSDYTARAVAGFSGDVLSRTIYDHNQQRKPRVYGTEAPPPSMFRKLLLGIKQTDRGRYSST
jgi:hypothetical protein